MNSGIYKITNLKNNKIYIGRAVDLKIENGDIGVFYIQININRVA